MERCETLDHSKHTLQPQILIKPFKSSTAGKTAFINCYAILNDDVTVNNKLQSELKRNQPQLLSSYHFTYKTKCKKRQFAFFFKRWRTSNCLYQPILNISTYVYNRIFLSLYVSLLQKYLPQGGIIKADGSLALLNLYTSPSLPNLTLGLHSGPSPISVSYLHSSLRKTISRDEIIRDPSS